MYWYLSFISDLLDGFVARKLNQTSHFGKELDRLVDSSSFGIIPVFLAYKLGFDSFTATLFCTLYLTCCLWRLAHFNINQPRVVQGRTFFTGLPSHISAGWFIASVIGLRWAGWLTPVFFYVYFPLAGALMVSGISYPKNGVWCKILYFALAVGSVLNWLSLA